VHKSGAVIPESQKSYKKQLINGNFMLPVPPQCCTAIRHSTGYPPGSKKSRWRTAKQKGHIRSLPELPFFMARAGVKSTYLAVTGMLRGVVK
jgi:hypothetical protein